MLDTRKMLSEVNAEIGRLSKIRDLLMTDGFDDRVPLGIKAPVATSTTSTITPAPAPASPVKPKRQMSPEGLAAIRAAVKKRVIAARKKGLSLNGQPLKKAAKKIGRPKKAAKKTTGYPSTQVGIQM